MSKGKESSAPAAQTGALGKCAKCGFEFTNTSQFRYTGKAEKICRGERDCRRRGGK